MLYEISTLSCPLLSIEEVSQCSRRWVSDAQETATVLGSWRTEIGTLGRLMILRRFETADALAAERRRALLSANPFHAGEVLTSLGMESYAPFAFLPPVLPRAYGPVYEFRTYHLIPGGLSPTLSGWEKAIEPAKAYTEHLVINMYALDGPPRITHIWGFASLEQRAALRASAYGAGVWPPQGGPEHILEATSTIALPQPWSPLH
ncbi:NIPSNAP family protein [Paludibacterium yongneupense]|uniref:NIPSNAP family protein n=1 Tax=Paludibacterium yongneupense TaxID=400061 RepID=UPI00048F0AB7|nr:NIPSNAP family protein [Paludibacterium yongneupense]